MRKRKELLYVENAIIKHTKGEPMKQEIILKEKDIPQKFTKWFKAAFCNEADKIDVMHEYDRSLSASENITIFETKFASLISEEYKLESQAKKSLMANEKIRIEELNKIKETEKKLIESWKKEPIKIVEIKSFGIARDFLYMVCKGLSHLAVLEGGGGIGKTYQALAVIQESKVSYEYLNTKITPLALYKRLYETQKKYEREQNTKKPRFVMLFDDVIGLWDNDVSIGILNAISWEAGSKRIVTYESTAKQAQNLPSAFEFTGDIIILSNKIPRKEHTEALLTRANYFFVDFSYNEKIGIMREIAKKPYANTTQEIRNEAMKLIEENATLTTENLNFRTLIKTFEFLAYDRKKAGELLKSTLVEDERLVFIYKMQKNNEAIDKQITSYCLHFGESRATFYRRKTEFKRLMKD